MNSFEAVQFFLMVFFTDCKRDLSPYNPPPYGSIPLW